MALQTARRRAQTQDEIRERKLKEETERIARGEPPSNLSLFNHPLTPNAHHSSCIEQDKSCSYQNCNLYKERQSEHSCHRGEPMGLYNLPPSTPGSSIDVEASHMPSSGDEDTAGTPSPRLAPSRPHVYRPPGMESEPNGVIPTRGKIQIITKALPPLYYEDVRVDTLTPDRISSIRTALKKMIYVKVIY